MAWTLSDWVCNYLRSKWLADDVSVDEAWSYCLQQIVERIKTYDPTRSSFSTWVFHQASYAALDVRRRNRREARIDERAREQRPTMEVSWDDDPEPLTVGERQSLHRARQRLTKGERQLLDMRFVEDMSYGEIAKVAGLDDPSRLRVAVFRAAKKLDRYYSEERGA